MADFGGFSVRIAEDLREYEGDPPVLRKAVDKILADDGFSRIRVRGPLVVPGRCDVAEGPIQAAAAGVGSSRINHDPPGDREQPGVDRRSGIESSEAAHPSDERLLGEVVGVGRTGKMRAKPPHVRLGRLDQRDEGTLVAIAGGDSQCGCGVEGLSGMPRPMHGRTVRDRALIRPPLPHTHQRRAGTFLGRATTAWS